MDNPNSPSSKILYPDWQPLYLAALAELDPWWRKPRFSIAFRLYRIVPMTLLNGRLLKVLWPTCAFSRGIVLDFPTGKRSKDHAAAGKSKARTLSIRTDTCSDFETKADIPADRASVSENTLLYSLNTITGTVGINVFRARAASMPFITGIDKSSTIKSGCKA
jgi:hypothetical protein